MAESRILHPAPRSSILFFNLSAAETHGHASPVIMEAMSTAVVVAVVVGLMLLGVGMVINQLVRLRRYLNDSPRHATQDGEPRDPPG